jgi:hypothetical protein
MAYQKSRVKTDFYAEDIHGFIAKWPERGVTI